MKLMTTSARGILGHVALPLGAALILVGTARAQENPVAWSLHVPPAAVKVKAGALVHAELTATMEAGWHLYSVAQPPPPIATRIGLAKGQPFTIDGTIEAPVPTSGFDENFGVNVEYYADQATFILPVRVAASTPPGPRTIIAEAFFQICNDRLCLPPQRVKAEAAVEILAAQSSSAASAPAAQVGGGSSAATAAPARSVVPARAPSLTEPASPSAASDSTSSAAKPAMAAPTSSPSDLRTTAIRQQSFGAFLWLALSMGALALLTPCVFPMVPITVSYFTSHAAGRRGAAVSQALIYSAGIILIFTALGMAMALLAGATSLSRFASSPRVNLLLGGLFIGFALNLLGFFEIRFPSSLLTRLDAATRQSGGRTIGTLLMALTFTLTSFTCTAPFIGTLLVMAAGGEWQWPLVGMLAFSTVFAFPFFVLALMPQLVASLPRSGAWMSSVKVMMGFLVIAASTKFISNADVVWGWGFLTRDVVLGSWVAIALLMMAYVLGMFRFQHDSPVNHVGIVRLATALGCGTLAFWLASGLTGKPLGEIDALLPLPSEALRAAAGTPSGGELSWLVNDYEGALAEAKQANRRVFLDFTGYTCTNCKWMETNMFPRPEVRRELERYVRVRLYTDGDGDLYRRQQQFQQTTFHTIALPFYAIFEPDGTPVTTFPGLTRDPAEFVAFLRSGRTAGP